MTYPAYQAPPIPAAFIWQRAHSFTGLFLTLFLIQHLLTNSQAALLLGDDGSGFVSAVNSIKSLPFLPIIEWGLIGAPFIIHGIWGIIYLRSVKYNSYSTDGSAPSLSQYPRNHAYTWQRITSWILLVGIIAHVIHMRFWEYPSSAKVNGTEYYMMRLNYDNGLNTLSPRLGFTIYDAKQVEGEKQSIASLTDSEDPVETQRNKQKKEWVDALLKRPIQNSHQVIAVANNFGVAELLLVRDSFKDPLMILLYTGLVLASCFHGFNGLWTFMISWGITLTERSQRRMRTVATTLMVLISFLGLAAVWGTYWVNLYS